MSSRLRTLFVAATALCGPALFAGAQIQSSGLGDVDPWGAGFLERGEQGFGNDLWTGSEADYLLALMERMDVSLLSPPERALLSRALRSPSAAPEGDLADILMEQRIRLLLALGERRAAATLADQADADMDDIDPDVILSDERLAQGEVDVVCAQMNITGEGRFWSELRAICAMKGDNPGGAELALEIAGQQEGAEAWFTETAFAYLREAEDRPAARYGSGLEMTLSDMAELEPGSESLTAARPDLAAIIARDEERDLSLRLEAAAIASQAGEISPAQHRELYQTLIEQEDFEPETAIETAFVVLQKQAEPVAPEPPADRPASSSGPVDLRAMTSGYSEPVEPDDLDDEETEEDGGEISVAEEQARAVGEALRQAATDPESFAMVSRLFGEALETIPARDDTAPAAHVFAAAALTNGSLPLTRKWLGTLPDDMPDADRYKATLLRAYGLLLSNQRAVSDIEDVATTLLESGYEPRQMQATLKLFSIWSGLDVPLPVMARSALAQSQVDARQVEPGMQVAIASAAKAGASGEALLTVLTQTDGRAETLSGAGLSTLLNTLQRIGAADEARRIALEAGEIWRVAAE